jgi:hypothetical protein
MADSLPLCSLALPLSHSGFVIFFEFLNVAEIEENVSIFATIVEKENKQNLNSPNC